MALRGEAGQISLLSIFQTLSLNRQSGVLEIRSSTATRKILFTSSGIRLLANEPGGAKPLDEILYSLKLLTPSQFQNVISTRNGKDQPLGDFLVQRRIIDPGILSGPVAQHILEYLFEPFSWADAKYEFNTVAETRGMELFDPSGVGAQLTFPVDAVLMEVSYREDEWQRIRESFPTENEILIPTDPGNFQKPRDYDSDISPEIIADVKALVDGERSVSRIAEATILSRFEALQVLVVLLRAGDVRPLTLPELKALAEKLRKHFKVDEVIDVLTYVLEQQPEDAESRMKLVELLERRKQRDPALVGHYTAVVEHLDRAGKTESMRPYLEKILAIDSNSLFARERLFGLLGERPERKEAIAAAKGLIDAIKNTESFAQGAPILERFVAKMPNDPGILMDLALIYERAGDVPKAVQWLKRIGDLYEAKGDLKRLRRTYERIAALDPSEVSALKRIQERERREGQSRVRSTAPLVVTCLVTALLLGLAHWAVLNIFSHSAYASVQPDVEQLTSSKRFAAARQTLEALKKAFPLTFAGLEITTRLEEINNAEVEYKQQSRKRREAENLLIGSLLVRVQKLLGEDRLGEVMKMIEDADVKALSEENRRRLDEISRDIRATFRRASAIRAEAEALSKSSRHREAHALFLKLLKEYPNTPAAKNARLPLVIRSVPARADVIVNDKKLGQTPLLVYYNPFERFELRVRLSGFKEYFCSTVAGDSKCLDFTRDWSLTLRLDPVPVWKLNVKAPIESSPTLDGERLYLGTRRGQMLCLDSESGKSRWSFTTPDNWDIGGPIELWKDWVYFSTYDGHLMAVNRHTGDKTLQLRVIPATGSKAALASPATPDGKIALAAPGYVVGVDLEAGKVAWRYPSRDLIVRAPLSYRDQFVIFDRDGQVVFLDVVSGQPKLSLQVGAPLVDAGSIFGDSLYLTDTNGKAYRMDLPGGGIRWSVALGTDAFLPPTVGDELLLLCSKQGRMVGLDIGTGALRWDNTIDDSFKSQGIVRRNQFIVGTKKGRFLCLDAFSGTLFWSFVADGALLAAPTVGATGIYAGSEKGILYRFNVH